MMKIGDADEVTKVNEPASGRRVRWPRTRRALRWIEHLLAAAVACFLLLVLSPLPEWAYARMDRQDPLRPAKYIICLGGNPNRVIEAVLLLNEGYGEKLIVSNNPAASPMMRDLAIEFGAAPDRVLMDNQSWRTADHPGSVVRSCGVDPGRDPCIIVTSYEHLMRSKACFEKAGYRDICMREVRWERRFHHSRGLRGHIAIMPSLVYEYAAMAEYWLRGYI